MKDQYVRYIILNYILDGNFDAAFSGDWIDSDEIARLKELVPVKAFAGYGLGADGKYAEIVDEIFNSLVGDRAIVEKGDDYSGVWYKLRTHQKNEVAQSLLGRNLAHSNVSELPDAALWRALKKIATEDGLGRIIDADITESVTAIDRLEAVVVPASDRVVSLNHNQILEFDGQVTELIEKLEEGNGEPDAPGLRERLLGQIKAGREFIRAGEFKAYLLYEVLVRALGELIEKYVDPTIKALANALLGALVSQILEG